MPSVDVGAAAGDHGRPAVRRPALHLARPVHLHDIGHDHQERIGVGDRGSEHRLGGLAEAGLVGEQELTVALPYGFEEPRLVGHDLEAPRRDPVELGDGRQVHARGRAAGAGLERLVQRTHELPAVEAPTRCVTGRTRREVGREERVRHLARLDRGRDDLLLGERRGHHGSRGRSAVGDDELVRRQLGAGFEQPVAAHAARDRRRGLVDLEQLDERRVARGGLGEDRGHAVEALQQLGARGVGDLGVGLDAGALLADEEGDHLELHSVGGAELAALGLGFDLAHLAGEDGDDGGLVVPTG